MEERTWRKLWIVSLASSGKEDGGDFVIVEMFTESMMEGVHVFVVFQEEETLLF